MLEEELLVICQDRECLSERRLQQNVPVNCTTSGTSKTSCNHLGYTQDGVFASSGDTYFVNTNGTICPRCMLSLLGPRPVYRNHGLPCS